MAKIPNVLTTLRIIMVFLFVYLYFSPLSYRYIAAGSVFALAGATDVIDGYLARRFKVVSHLGKILDPVADKLMQIAVFICLYLEKLIPWWLLLLFATKEFILLLGGALILKRGKKMESSNWYGKVATVLIYLAVLPLVLFHSVQSPVWYLLMALAILWSFVALFLYIRDRRDSVKKK